MFNEEHRANSDVSHIHHLRIQKDGREFTLPKYLGKQLVSQVGQLVGLKAVTF